MQQLVDTRPEYASTAVSKAGTLLPAADGGTGILPGIALDLTIGSAQQVALPVMELQDLDPLS